MRAAVATRYGPPEVIELAEVPDPSPDSKEVLVWVRASSLNPIDVKLRSGSLRPLLRLRFPAVLGYDFAGEIVALGSGVEGLGIGAQVYGRTTATTGGTHAELAAVGADAIASAPAELTMEEAASLPLTAMTAVQALRWARLRAGDRLLVIGASGGVGTMAVQIGHAWDAEVTGVCRGDAANLVRQLGAARVLDYTRGELDASEERFDVVFDTVFSRPAGDYARWLRPDGRYVTTGFSPRLALRATIGRLLPGPRYGFVISRANGAIMREVTELVEVGKLVPVIDSRYSIERAAEAHARMEEGHLRGKIVLAID